MPGSTTTYGLPYQELSDAPDGPDLGQNLAEAVEAELERIDADLFPNSVGFGEFAGSTHSTTSGSYADLASPSSATIVKSLASTTLKVSLYVQFASSATDTGVEFAVRISGTDYLVAPYHQALPNDTARLTAAGTIFVTGISAGSHTVQVRWRRSSGAGTISRIINDDWISLVVEEVR